MASSKLRVKFPLSMSRSKTFSNGAVVSGVRELVCLAAVSGIPIALKFLISWNESLLKERKVVKTNVARPAVLLSKFNSGSANWMVTMAELLTVGVPVFSVTEIALENWLLWIFIFSYLISSTRITLSNVIDSTPLSISRLN